MENVLYSNNDYRYYSLSHHGVKGQKWHVRRYQNEDGSLTSEGREHYGVVKTKGRDISERARNKQIRRINTMYDRSNMWTERKIRKLDKKGKTAKADVMRVMVKKNDEARKEKIDALNKMTKQKELRKSKMRDVADWAFGGQNWMKNNASNMTTFMTRLNEYNTQRGMRWMSNFTLNSTLQRMSPEEGYDYLKRKEIERRSYYQGYNNGSNR